MIREQPSAETPESSAFQLSCLTPVSADAPLDGLPTFLSACMLAAGMPKTDRAVQHLCSDLQAAVTAADAAQGMVETKQAQYTSMQGQANPHAAELARWVSVSSLTLLLSAFGVSARNCQVTPLLAGHVMVSWPYLCSHHLRGCKPSVSSGHGQANPYAAELTRWITVSSFRSCVIETATAHTHWQIT